jgi:hypothetical protein
MPIEIRLSLLQALSPRALAVGLTVENSDAQASSGLLSAWAVTEAGKGRAAGQTVAAGVRLRVTGGSRRAATLVVPAEGFLQRGAVTVRAEWAGQSGSATAEFPLRLLPVMRVHAQSGRWWRSSSPVVMDSPQFACELMGDWWHGPDDLSAKLYFGWNPAAFLFAADVSDDVHCQPYPDATMYHGDCVQLFLDVLKNGAVPYAENDDYDFLLGDTPLGPLAYAASMPPDRLPLRKDVSLRIRRGPRGNRFYDLRLPEGAVKDLRLTPGTVIGATVVVNDNDGHGRRGWLELTEKAGTTRDIRTFLNLVLCDEEFLRRATSAEPGQPVAVAVRPRERTLRGDGLAETRIDLDVRDGGGSPSKDTSLVRVAVLAGGAGILSSHTVQTTDGRGSVTLRSPIGAYRNVVIEAVPLGRPGTAGYARLRFTEDRDHFCVLGRLDLAQPGLRSVGRAVKRGDLPGAGEVLLRHFRSRRDLKLTAKGLRGELSEERITAVLAAARETLAQLRASAPVGSQQAHSGKERFYRLGVWNQLAQAYVLTGEEAFCRVLVRALREYSKGLPASLNGHCLPKLQATLDIGLSLSNAVAAYRGLLHWPGLTAGDHARFLRLLLVMASFLEPRHGPANWMTMEAAGLADVAFRFPEFADSRRWVERVLFLSDGQALAQVRPDGMHYEQSPGYHLAALNSWQTVLTLADKYGVRVPDRFRRAVRRMYEAILYLAQPNWRCPNLGDSGEGDIRDTMSRAVKCFRRREFRFPLERDLPARGRARPPRRASVLLPHAGYCVMRSDWSPDALYLVADYGPWGYPNGHSHEDSLSIIVNGFGRKLITETGVFSYARDEWRAYFAGAVGHNTCTVDGRGMGFVDAELLTWRTNRQYDFVDGLHRGYAPVIHRRAVLFLKPAYWLLLDVFTGDRERHTVCQHFHFMPSETPAGSQIRPDTLAAWSGYRDANILIHPLRTEGLRVEKHDGWYCGQESKGDRSPAPEVRYIYEGRLPVILGTLLVPFPGVEPPEVRYEVEGLEIPLSETDTIRARLQVILPTRQDTIALPLP